ncbi:dihydrofolate reductase [Priestia megaterium]
MITLIAALDNNNAIGCENKLLCRLKDDMRHFVDKTTNKPVIMGATTFASLGNKPLKNRFNIVLTKARLPSPLNIWI